LSIFFSKVQPLPRRTATAIKDNQPLPHRYRHSGGGAAAVAAAAAPPWTSLAPGAKLNLPTGQCD
jgi:hypothetical protein